MEAGQSSTTSGGAGPMRQALLDFLEGHQGQIDALEAAARDQLSAIGNPYGIRITIAVRPSEAAAEDSAPGTECWEVEYICGKSETGYTTCSKTVCMEVGPVTLSA